MPTDGANISSLDSYASSGNSLVALGVAGSSAISAEAFITVMQDFMALVTQISADFVLSPADSISDLSAALAASDPTAAEILFYSELLMSLISFLWSLSPPEETISVLIHSMYPTVN